jgi:transposase
MDFVAWTRPSDEAIAVRGFARRITALTGQKAAAKHTLHALIATQETPKSARRDAQPAIAHTATLEKRADRLTAEALILIGKHPQLERIFTLLIGIKGMAETSAIALMGELLLLPPGLSHRDWGSLPGLIPRPSMPAKASTRKPGYPRPVTGLSVQPLICLP